MSKRALCLLLALALIFCSTGCTLPFKRTPEEPPEVPEDEDVEQTQASMRKTVLYFVDEQDLLVPVTSNIPWVEGIAREALEYLVASPQRGLELSGKGLRPSLPEGTQVLGMTIRDGVAKVDFNAEFLSSPDKTAEKNAINAVVYTLTEFPTVDRVQILVEGKTVKKCPQGTELTEVLNRERINLEPTEAPLTGSAIPTTLYFRSMGGGGFFVPVTRMVEPSDDPIKTALEELVKGPAENMGLMPILPAQTKVLGVTSQGPEVVVDFSKDIEYYGGGVELEHALINSVVLTVSEFSGVEKVSIQVEGEAVVLPEGTSLDVPILKPLYINPGNI